MVTAGFFAIIGAWMYYPPQGDGASLAVLNTLTGMMGTSFAGVITYFFGSSSGSKAKDDTIAQMKTASSTDTTVTTTTPPTVTTTTEPHAPPAAP